MFCADCDGAMWCTAESNLPLRGNPRARRLYAIGFVFEKSRNANVRLSIFSLLDIAHLHFRSVGDRPALPRHWMGAQCPSISPGALRIGAHQSAAHRVFRTETWKFFYFLFFAAEFGREKILMEKFSRGSAKKRAALIRWGALRSRDAKPTIHPDVRTLFWGIEASHRGGADRGGCEPGGMRITCGEFACLQFACAGGAGVAGRDVAV